MAHGSPAPTAGTKHSERGGAVQLSTDSKLKKTPNGCEAAATAVQIGLHPNLQALVAERKGLAEAWTDQSHCNDDEWEINAHTSETI